jgi:CHASE3 domain sensor protein
MTNREIGNKNIAPMAIVVVIVMIASAILYHSIA